MASLRRSFQVKKAGSMCQAEGRACAKPGECRGKWREQKRLGSCQGSGNCKRHLPGERYWALHGPAVGSNSGHHHCLALSRLGAALHASWPVGWFPGSAFCCELSCLCEAGGSGTLFHPGVFLANRSDMCLRPMWLGGDREGLQAGETGQREGERRRQGSTAAASNGSPLWQPSSDPCPMHNSWRPPLLPQAPPVSLAMVTGIPGLQETISL